MAQSIRIAGYGTIGTPPATATFGWLPSVGNDPFLIELFENLLPGEVEFISNVDQVTLKIEEFKLRDFKGNVVEDIPWTNGAMLRPINNRYIKMSITDLNPAKVLPAKKFTVHIRHIDTAVVLGNITFNMEERVKTATLSLTNLFRKWITNTNYGSGTTRVNPDGTILLNRIPLNYPMEVPITVIDTSKEGMQPIVNIYSTRADITSVTENGGAPTLATEGNSRIAKYYPTLNTLIGENAVGITMEPIIRSLGRAKGGRNAVGIILNKQNNVNTASTPHQNNLAWGSSHRIILDTWYPGFDLQTSMHPSLAQGVNNVTLSVDNQQEDIILCTPYVWKHRFHVMVQPIKTVLRAGIVGLQVNSGQAWDSGFYSNKTVRFDLIAGPDTTPIGLAEDEVWVLEGDTHPYKVITPATAYAVTVKDSNIAQIDKNNNLVIGVKAGDTEATFTATYAPLKAGTAKLKIHVLKIPEASLTINRKKVIVAVGDSTAVKIKATRADTLKFDQQPPGHVTVFDYTTYDRNKATVEGRINIRGEKVGITTLLVTSVFRSGEILTDVIEVEVIPRGTYIIKWDPNKIKVDIKKNDRNKGRKGVPFWATTNAKYIKMTYPQQESFYHEGEPVFESLNTTFWPKTKRGKYFITLYGHMLDPNVRVVEVQVQIKVTKNVEVPKDEAWIGLEHKQIGQPDNADLDERYFTLIKWLKRDKISDIMSHRIFLPNRPGTLLTQKLLEENSKFPKRYFEYAKAEEPTRVINPPKAPVFWLNTQDGKIWKCIDNTTDNNSWVCEDGRQIGKVEQMIYPEAGEKGFGVGPMSSDLHEKYGLTPMDGCFDVTSDNYGNYVDQYGNVYVCIPKHYIRLNGTKNKG